MIYQESRQVRRIVGRLDRGDECVDRLTEFCGEHDIRAARLRAVGRLSEVELVRFDEEEGDYVPIFSGEGNFEVVQLEGNVSTLGEEVVVRLQGLLSAPGAAGPQLLAGQLRSATAVEFEFVAEVFDDLRLDRQLDSESGMLTLQSIERVEEAAESREFEGQSMSWDDAADDAEVAEAPSEAAEETTDETEEAEDEEEGADEEEEETSLDLDMERPPLESGDIVDHPKLGRCTVIKIEEDKYAHIRLPQGKIRKLSLNVVQISYSGEEDGRNVFEAQVSP